MENNGTWKLRKAMKAKGTLKQGARRNDNPNNPTVDNHIKSRREFKDKWQDVMRETFSADPNPTPLPPDLAFIDAVDPDQLRASAQVIDVTAADIS